SSTVPRLSAWNRRRIDHRCSGEAWYQKRRDARSTSLLCCAPAPHRGIRTVALRNHGYALDNSDRVRLADSAGPGLLTRGRPARMAQFPQVVQVDDESDGGWYLALDEEEEADWDRRCPRNPTSEWSGKAQRELEASWARIFDLEQLAKSPLWAGERRWVQAVVPAVLLGAVRKVTPFTAR